MVDCQGCSRNFVPVTSLHLPVVLSPVFASKSTHPAHSRADLAGMAPHSPLIPVEAGIQGNQLRGLIIRALDPRFRGGEPRNSCRNFLQPNENFAAFST